jgi:hypothetical protein
MKPTVPVFPFYLVALFFITRSTAIPGKTVMWMLITLFVTMALFIGLAGFASFPEAAYGSGGSGSLIGMVASVAVWFDTYAITQTSCAINQRAIVKAECLIDRD